VQSLFWRGNTFLLPMARDSQGQPKTVIVANPDEVEVDWDKNKIFRVYTWRDKPMEPGKDIIHISINRMPGHHSGVGPITAAARLMQGMKAEGNAARRLYEDDATPGGALKVNRQIDKAEAEEILEIWEATHQGRKRPGVMGHEVDWKSITMSALDAQFLENRQFSVQEIARMIGVPGYFLLVQSGDSLTYSTTESLFRLWLTMSLNPIYLEPIQQAFSKLLPLGTSARFDTSEILRADLLTRYQANQIGLSAGFLTPDEVRAGEGLPPMPEAHAGEESDAAA
jgi:HK97 family phage portal protein